MKRGRRKYQNWFYQQQGAGWTGYARGGWYWKRRAREIEAVQDAQKAPNQ